MNKPIFFIFVVLFAMPLLFAVETISAQSNAVSPETTRDYEVTFQVLVGSNDSNAENKLPSALNGAAKKIKDNFALDNLRLVSTFYERCGANSGIEHKGILNPSAQNAEIAPRFSEWKILNLSSTNNTDGKPTIQLKYFYYGMRIPVAFPFVKTSDTDKNSQPITYESTGLSLNQVNLPENTPTVIGSMETGKTDEILFFVLTVKSNKS